MELSNFKVEESRELATIQEFELEESIFTDLVDKIITNMSRIGISLEDKCVFYQRFANKTSILAIKLGKGEDSDTNNFMFNGCDAMYFDGTNTCDVYLHANKKVGQEAMQMANIMSRDIVEFFDTIEGELILKGLSNSELFIKILLVKQQEKSNDKKENKVLKFVKNIFKK